MPVNAHPTLIKLYKFMAICRIFLTHKMSVRVEFGKVEIKPWLMLMSIRLFVVTNKKVENKFDESMLLRDHL